MLAQVENRNIHLPDRTSILLDVMSKISVSGSGYLTVCLSKLVGESGKVVGVERIPELLSFGINNAKRSLKLQHNVSLPDFAGALFLIGTFFVIIVVLSWTADDYTSFAGMDIGGTKKRLPTTQFMLVLRPLCYQRRCFHS